MPRRILQRLLQSLLECFVLFTLTFLLVKALPGGPFQNDRAIPDHLRQETEEFHGLKQTAWDQFTRALDNLAHLDAGTSLRLEGHQVSEIIGQALPFSLELALAAMLFAAGIGIPAGTIAAARPKSFACHGATILAMLGLGLPSVVLGPLLADIFGRHLRCLPAIGWDLSRPETWILPAVTLGLLGAACWCRATRAALLEMPAQDSARPRHCLRACLVAALASLGPVFAATLAGSVVVEVIFRIPGLGPHFLKAVETGDAPVIQCNVLLYGTLIITIKLLADLARLWLDPRSTPPGEDAWGRLRRNPATVTGMVVLATITLACLVGPLVPLLPDPGPQDPSAANAPPCGAHCFGTDHLGRDLLARVLCGGRISLAVGFAATLVALAIGAPWGIVAGCAGGRTGALLTRIVEVLCALPSLVIVILLAAILAPAAAGLTEWTLATTAWRRETVEPLTTLVPLVLAIGALSWFRLAGRIRAQAQSVATSESVRAAHARGCGSFRILIRQILPKVLGPILTCAILTMPTVMWFEAVLSFLGLGVKPPLASWGGLIESGANRLLANPFPLLIPAAFFSATVLALHLLGHGLREPIDPTPPAEDPARSPDASPTDAAG